jgi:preprotein translocase subunit SecB
MSEEQQAQPQLALERIYTKDISFEVPGAQVFTKEWQPELNINLSSAAEKVDATHFEVSLKVVVQANNAGDTAFIVDVTQSGIFLIDGIEEDRLPYILGAYCPNILFPFLREAVNDLVTKGSFPQLLLTPTGFLKKKGFMTVLLLLKRTLTSSHHERRCSLSDSCLL